MVGPSTRARPVGSTVPGNRWDLFDGVHPSELPTVSVIVVHFEQHPALARTLAALARQTLPPYEVIVVDDGSSIEPVVGEHVQLIVQEDVGFRLSAARNAGAARATGSVLCFLDADTAPERDYLEKIARLPTLLPEAVVVGRRRHADLAEQPMDAAIEEVGPLHELPEPEWLRSAYERSGNLLRSDDRSYRYVIGAVFACRRWLFGQTAGFDESFDSYGGEDWDWAHRAWLAGAILAHEPEAVAWHDGPEFDARGSDAARRTQKTAETLALAARIPVPGSRGSGLGWAAPDVLAVLAPDLDAASAVITVDALLASVPSLMVILPRTEWSARLEDPRVRVDDELHARLIAGDLDPLPAPLSRARRLLLCHTGIGRRAAILTTADDRGTALEDRFATLADALRPDLVGRWSRSEVTRGGQALLQILDLGAVRREARWQRNDLFPTRRIGVDELAPLGPTPSLAAHFGAWS